VELASDISIAFLTVLERLAPKERAAFLLHEVFDFDYSEISQIIGKNQAACRRLTTGARESGVDAISQDNFAKGKLRVGRITSAGPFC
jgi:DNA-directed RNA polymerase specialized sigma24 family protein